MGAKKRGVYVGPELGEELEEEARRKKQSVSKVARERMKSKRTDAAADGTPNEAELGPSSPKVISTALPKKPPTSVRVRAVPRPFPIHRTNSHVDPPVVHRARVDDIAYERDYWFLQALQLEQERRRLIGLYDELEREASYRPQPLLVRRLPKVRLLRR